jgi:fatty acid desaturase
MKVLIIFYLVLLGSGVLLDGFKSVRYWRARNDNSNKLAALMLAKTAFDLAGFGIIIWLWYGDVASEWTIVLAVLPVIGIFTGGSVLLENKLATGKFISIPGWTI